MPSEIFASKNTFCPKGAPCRVLLTKEAGKLSNKHNISLIRSAANALAYYYTKVVIKGKRFKVLDQGLIFDHGSMF